MSSLVKGIICFHDHYIIASKTSCRIDIGPPPPIPNIFCFHENINFLIQVNRGYMMSLRIPIDSSVQERFQKKILPQNGEPLIVQLFYLQILDPCFSEMQGHHPCCESLLMKILLVLSLKSLIYQLASSHINLLVRLARISILSGCPPFLG